MRLELFIKKLVCSIMVMVLGCGISVGIVNPVYAAENEAIDIEIRLSDLIDIEELAAYESDVVSGKSIRHVLINPDNGQNAVEIIVNFDYEYSDGNSVRITSINSATLNAYPNYGAQWNGAGQIFNDSVEATYKREFIVHNSITDSRTIYRYYLIVDIYGDFDDRIQFLGGY